MKSYILGIVVAMILSAVYAMSNTAEITIRFLSVQTTFPQGIWEVIVFALGALIMWIVSTCAAIETYIKNRRKTKELTKRIVQLEDERKSLFATLHSFGWKDRDEDVQPSALQESQPKYVNAADAKTHVNFDPYRESEPHRELQHSREPESSREPELSREPEKKVILDKPESSDDIESRKNAEVKPSFVKTLVSSIFKRKKNDETGHEAAEVSEKTDAQTAPPESIRMTPEPAADEYDAQEAAEIENKEKSEI
ncbi:MAG: LapA family protein [Synergistaceae bacterium]|jgi:uncharacterized integral membrane protein|nr:LapA family protein [Synergistaceae bacterium]